MVRPSKVPASLSPRDPGGPAPRSFRVTSDEGLIHGIRQGTRAFARALGFSDRAVEELVIVVSELASNIRKYGIKGTLELAHVEDVKHGLGILMVAQDETPPFDLSIALLDGHDATGKLDPATVLRRRGIGAGLGAVARFSDQLTVEPCPGGKRLRVIRYVSRPKPSPATSW